MAMSAFGVEDNRLSKAWGEDFREGLRGNESAGRHRSGRVAGARIRNSGAGEAARNVAGRAHAAGAMGRAEAGRAAENVAGRAHAAGSLANARAGRAYESVTGAAKDAREGLAGSTGAGQHRAGRVAGSRVRSAGKTLKLVATSRGGKIGAGVTGAAALGAGGYGVVRNRRG